jgi:hypothetical protein
MLKVLSCKALCAAFIRDPYQSFEAGIVNERAQIGSAIAFCFRCQLLNIDIGGENDTACMQGKNAQAGNLVGRRDFDLQREAAPADNGIIQKLWAVGRTNDEDALIS